MSRKIESAWSRYITRRHKAGDALKVIRPISELASGANVVLCVRVSERAQGGNGNLSDQAENGRLVLAGRAHVLRVFGHVGPGWDPWWLAAPAAYAREHNAVLVAETTDRFMRHPDYHSEDHPDLQARDFDLEYLRWWTDGVPLFTILPPNATPGEVRAYQTKRG